MSKISTTEGDSIPKDKATVKAIPKFKWCTAVIIFLLLLYLFVSSVAYGAADPNCTICEGKGWYFCDGKMDHLGHVVGDNTYQDPDTGEWSCGFCDGAGDPDPDYEQYKCSKCGYIGLESEELYCYECGNLINEFNTMAHILPCDCTAVTPTPTPSPIPSPEPVYYTVKYDGNGASGSMSDSEHQVGVPKDLNSNEYYIKHTVAYNQGDKEATITTKSQNTDAYAAFKGWAESSSGTPKYSDRETVTDLRTTAGTVWLYAIWGNCSIMLPDATCKEPGYQLAGWKNESGRVISVRNLSGSFKNVSYTVTGNETLTAVWEPIVYEITFVSDLTTSSGTTRADTEGTTSLKVTYNTTGADITVPTLGQYTFDGYYTAVDSNGKPTGEKYYDASGKWCYDANEDGATDPYTVAGDMTLYTKWKEKEKLVRLDDRGATSTNHTEEVIMNFDEYGPAIVVPEKTGYTFHGYFTEIKGGGTKYYDETGTCIKTWMETDVNVLYAYWIQDIIELPEEDKHPEPELFPETVVEGIVKRTDAKALLYADDYNASTGALNDLQPYLTYDTPGSEGAIPGTELLSFRARVGSWMLSYKFHRYTGKDMVKIIVTVPYRTQYELANEELVISDCQTKEYSFLVPKAWSYWSVAESGMYYPEKITITNDAFKDDSITVTVNREDGNAVKSPAYEATNYGDKSIHVRWPEYDENGVPVLYITLDKEEYIISDVVNSLPNVDAHLSIVCKNAAWKDDQEADVRSDRFVFAGETVLSDEWQKKNGGELDITKLPADGEDVELTSYLQTYQSGIELDELKPNGSYATTAVITYVGDAKNIGVAEAKEEALTDINGIKIHTPVACDGVIVDGMEEGVLILKDALNFFTLHIDNTGTHRMNLGYGTRDFATALSGKSNVAEQEGGYLNHMQFPFAVYVDVGNNSLNEDGSFRVTGDCYYEAETWITIGNQNKTFYVPLTQKNGTYRVKFRTIAVNCPKEEETYLTDSVEQEKVNTDPAMYVATDSMELIIRSYLLDFVITGTDDPTALQQLKAGKQALTLKKGYGFSYELLTQGEFYGKNTEIMITPKFFRVSEDESERQEVELYYATYVTDKEQRECYPWEEVPLLEKHENYEVILQRFSGSGKIPAKVICVPTNMKQKYGFSMEEYAKVQTLTGQEEFIMQNGYLVINFDIKVKSEEGIWYTFENWVHTKLGKEALDAGWNYLPGDVIRYDLSKSITEDYEVGGVE